MLTRFKCCLDWKVIGTLGLYIQYNPYKLDAPQLKYKDVIRGGHMNLDVTRYEQHRVWHVTAALKPGETPCLRQT